MVFFLMFISILLVGFALIGFILNFFFNKQRRELENKRITNIPKDGVVPGHCPLCGSPLYDGKQIQSVVFKGGNEKDRRCNIVGCPHCHPYPELGLKRICPVCKKEVPIDGFLITRLFLRDNGTQHVHIIGCTECAKKQAERKN